MKRCTMCKTEKDLSEFWYSKSKAQYVAECHECRKARGKLYRDNPERKELAREVSRKWRKDHPETLNRLQMEWRERNPGLAAERTAIWRKENRERALRGQRNCHRKLKNAAYAAYGGFQCACCGETEEGFLSIDHVNNDGAHHRKNVSHRKLPKWLKKNGYPEGFQILCMNCNFGKARNGGVCPHQTRTSDGSTTIPQGSTLQAIGSGSAGLLSFLG